MLAMQQRDLTSHMSDAARQYLQGHVSYFGLSDALTSALMGAHVQATYLGRRLSGNVGPSGLADQQFAQTVVLEQHQYLVGLINDIATGKYPLNADALSAIRPVGEDGPVGGTLSAVLVRRIGMYAARLRGTANQSWALAQAVGTLVNWVLHPAEHCSSCEERAAGSPYDAHTIPWVPSDGSSECGVNCKCTLELVGGGSGF